MSKIIFATLSFFTLSSCIALDSNDFSKYNNIDIFSHTAAGLSWLFGGNEKQCINPLKYNQPDDIDDAQKEVGMNSYEKTFGGPHGCHTERVDY